MSKNSETNLQSNKSVFLLGAPIRRAEQRAFENALLTRYGGDAEKAFMYIEKVLDRQINKTRGILTSTSILAGVALVMESFGAIIAAFISVFMLLSIFFVQWDSLPRYQNAEADFKATCRTCYTRSIIMSIAILLSVASIVLLIVDYIIIF